MTAPRSFVDNLANLRLVLSVALEYFQANSNQFLKSTSGEQRRQAETRLNKLPAISILRGPSRRRYATPSRNNINLQRRIGGRHIGHRQPKLSSNNIAALGDCARLVEGYLAVAALPPEATVARHN